MYALSIVKLLQVLALAFIVQLLFPFASKKAESEEVGTDAPVPPPEVVLQFPVLPQLPSPVPIQYLSAIHNLLLRLWFKLHFTLAWFMTTGYGNTVLRFDVSGK